MKPALADTVLVFVDPFYNNGSDVAPARITRACDDETVNVRIDYDGPAVPPEHRIDWMTGVPVYRSRLTAETAHAEKWSHVDHEVPRFGAFPPPPARLGFPGF